MEKGGKGSFKGQDDPPAKSKRGRKVHFEAQGSPELSFNFSPSISDGKASTPFSKGKGEKAANGGKFPVAKESQLELKVEEEFCPELPKNVECLMDCEAANILLGIQEQMILLSRDPTIKLPISFDRGLQYVKTNNHYTNPQAVREVLDSLTDEGVSDSEICMIANICPESVDEIFGLVPSLKGKRSKLTEPLQDALDELAKLKKST